MQCSYDLAGKSVSAISRDKLRDFDRNLFFMDLLRRVHVCSTSFNRAIFHFRLSLIDFIRRWYGLINQFPTQHSHHPTQSAEYIQ